MPTFIAAIIVGAVRALVAVAAILVAAAGCGGGRQAWPDCLRVLGATHVHVATAADLHKSPKIFAATRATALGSAPSVIDMPGRDTPPQRPSAVRRQGTILVQWFGRRNARREHVLLDCAAS